MFIVILTIIALADYIITFYCLVNMVIKPTVEAEETPKDIFDEYKTIDCADMGYVCDDEEFNRYIEEQNSRIAALSSNVNEILSNIDAIVERREVNQEALSA